MLKKFYHYAIKSNSYYFAWYDAFNQGYKDEWSVANQA